MRKGGERGHQEGTSRKKKPEVSRKLASIKADPKNNNNHVKMWTTLCPFDFATSNYFSNFGENCFKDMVE